jgi:uncharacterized protein YeaC (DUF1315 family)
VVPGIITEEAILMGYEVDYRQMIEAMTPEMYRSLKTAVELGKWPDGRRLSPEQREESLQAVIAWGERHLTEKERVGYIDKRDKPGDDCDQPEPLRWKE